MLKHLYFKNPKDRQRWTELKEQLEEVIRAKANKLWDLTTFEARVATQGRCFNQEEEILRDKLAKECEHLQKEEDRLTRVVVDLEFKNLHYFQRGRGRHEKA